MSNNKKYTLDQTLVKFRDEEPFYGYINRYIEKKINTNIPTARVFYQNERHFMEINESFFLNLPLKERFGLLIHELFHIKNCHTTGRGQKFVKNQETAKRWNIATDLANNSFIPEDMLPKCGLLPGRWRDLTEEEIENKDPHIVEAHQKLGNIIKKLPKFKNSEFYFKALEVVSEDIEKMSKDNESLIMDDHGKWSDDEGDNGDDKDKDEELDQVIKKAFEHCKRKGKWGSVCSQTIRELEEKFSRQIRWQDILQRFTGNAKSIDKTRSIKKIDRRYPYIHPGPKNKTRSRIAICIDHSASMSNAIISLFFSELYRLSKHTDFVVIPFDTKVHEDHIFTWKRGQKVTPKRVASGGTNFSIPTEYINKRKSQFDACLFLTDGGAAKPIRCLVPRAYILEPGCKLAFQTSDLVIKMK